MLREKAEKEKKTIKNHQINESSLPSSKSPELKEAHQKYHLHRRMIKLKNQRPKDKETMMELMVMMSKILKYVNSIQYHELHPRV